jgi:hypothetical protein
MSLGLLNTLCKLLQRVINTIWHVIIGIGDILTNKCRLKSCKEPVMSLRKGYQYRLTPSNNFSEGCQCTLTTCANLSEFIAKNP